MSSGSIAAVWILITLSAIGLGFLAFVFKRKHLFHWERCSRFRLSAGSFGDMTLLIYRVVCAGYIFGIWAWVVSLPGGVNQEGQPIHAFSFYTIWNFTMLMVYFCLAAFQSLRARITATSDDKTPSSAFVDRTTFALFEICAAMVLLVDVVLWSVLYPHAIKSGNQAAIDGILNFGSYNVHGANLLFMAGEMVLSQMVVVPSHVLFVGVWLFAYGIYSWIRAADHRGWVYFFMDTTQDYAAVWYAGLMLMHGAFYFCGFLFAKLKMKLLRQEYDQDVEVQFLMAESEETA
eukprot:m.34229 g.34229  ORF g.34229 m.34229 type:complete len:290 (+) comp9750_c0_seq1:27-896(+)